MTDTVSVQIGGEAVALPLVLNFAQLERIWPAWKAFGEATDRIGQVSAACAFVACIVVESRPELTLPEIKRRLRINRREGADERDGMVAVIGDVLLASGVIVPGEGEPPAQPAA